MLLTTAIAWSGTKFWEVTRNAFIAFHKQKMSVPKAQIEYEKVMIAEHGEEAWNRLSAERSICPDNKLAYNLWQRLNWVSRGSLNGLDALYKSSGICKSIYLKALTSTARVLETAFLQNGLPGCLWESRLLLAIYWSYPPNLKGFQGKITRK